MASVTAARDAESKQSSATNATSADATTASTGARVPPADKWRRSRDWAAANQHAAVYFRSIVNSVLACRIVISD